MLTETPNVNIFDNDYLIVALVEECVVHCVLQVDLVAFGQEQQRLGIS